MAFKKHPQAERRQISAITLVKMLLANKKPEVLPAHYRKLFSTLLWMITEAESSKYKTRFQSHGALECSDERKLRHEHVYQRSKRIDALVKAEPEEVDGILKDAIGCTVTIDEASRLSEFHHEYGWERYRKAGIVVLNTETGKQLI